MRAVPNAARFRVEQTPQRGDFRVAKTKAFRGELTEHTGSHPALIRSVVHGVSTSMPMAITVSQSVTPYMAPSMCISMVISSGTTRKVGGCIGAPKNLLGTVVAISSGVTESSPMRRPAMFIRMNR